MGWVQGSGVRRALGASGVALATFLTLSSLAALPAQATQGRSASPSTVRTADAGSGTATISGRIVVPGAGAAPDGVTVTLTAVPPTGDPITRTAVTRGGGQFTFRDLAGGDWGYTVSAPYQGTTFATDLVSVPAGQGLVVKLPVFASTESPASVRTAGWIVWIDTTGGKLAVQQDLSFTNGGTAAYTGTTTVPGTTDGAKAAVLLPTAAGASGFQYLGRFEVCCSAVQNGAWAHTRPINPGGSSGTLRYEAPTTDSLTFTAQFPTDSFTLLVPAGTTATSPQLTADGTSSDRGVTYSVFKGSALKAGDTITVSLVAPAPESSTPWGLIALGAVVLVAVAAVVALVVLRRRRATVPVTGPSAKGSPVKGSSAKSSSAKSSSSKSSTAKSSTDKGGTVTNGSVTDGSRKNGSANGAASTSTAGTSTTSPKSARETGKATSAESLTEQLAALDLKFENGELSDETAYRRVRESLVQQLVDTVANDPSALH